MKSSNDCRGRQIKDLIKEQQNIGDKNCLCHSFLRPAPGLVKEQQKDGDLQQRADLPRLMRIYEDIHIRRFLFPEAPPATISDL